MYLGVNSEMYVFAVTPVAGLNKSICRNAKNHGLTRLLKNMPELTNKMNSSWEYEDEKSCKTTNPLPFSGPRVVS